MRTISEDDRKNERATSGISGERDPGENWRGRDLLFFPTRSPARRPLAFSIVPTDREPGTGYKNMSDTVGYRLVCHVFVLTKFFDVFCGQLQNRRTSTWTLPASVEPRYFELSGESKNNSK